MSIYIIFLLMIVLVLSGVPISYCFLIPALLFVGTNHMQTAYIVSKLVDSYSNFTMLCVPLFILTASIMGVGSIMSRIFDFCKCMLGGVKGGLGHVVSIFSFIFAGISGSAIANMAGPGKMLIGAMEEKGYDKEYTVGITMGASLLGPIVPPSNPGILYCMLTGASVGQVFVGGVGPGVVIVIGLMLMILFMPKYNRYMEPKVSRREKWVSFKRAFFPLLTPFILLAGIVSGLFTPTETAAVAAAYASILTIIIQKDKPVRTAGRFYQAFAESSTSTGNVLIIYGTATILAWVFTIQNLPQHMVTILTSIGTGKWLVLMEMMVIVLILGCFLDPVPIILICTPLFLPLLIQYHVNLVHFGVAFVLATQIGFLTPPVGMGLYIGQDITGLSFGRVIRGCFPFVVLFSVIVFILIYVPEITLFLVHVFYG